MLEEDFPFTPENQRTLLFGQLEANKKKRLEKLLNNLQAECLIPSVNDRDLLEQNLVEAVANLKNKSIWQTIRTHSLEEIVEKLVSKAREGNLLDIKFLQLPTPIYVDFIGVFIKAKYFLQYIPIRSFNQFCNLILFI